MAIELAFTVAKGADDLSNNSSAAYDTSSAAPDFIAVVMVGGFTITFSDSETNSWSDCGAGYVQVGDSSKNVGVRILTCKNPVLSASHVFTGSSGYQGPRFTVYGLKGTASSPIGLYGTKQLTAGTTITANSLEPADDGSFLIFGVASNGAAPDSFDSGFTEVGASGAGAGVASGYLLQGAKSAVAPTATWLTSQTGSAILLAVKPAPATGGVPLLAAARMGAGLLDLNGGFVR